MTEVADTQEFADGEVIVAEGERAPAVYFVVEGRVKVSTVDESGREVVLARLQCGEMFGEMSLMGDVPASATVSADGPVAVQRMTLDDFLEAVKSPLARMVMESLFARLRRMNTRISELSAQSGEARMVCPHDLQITAVSGVMRDLMGDEALVVTRFPFHIGRGKDDSKMFFFSMWHNDLVIEESAPYNVSRKHCLIDKRRDGYYLVDAHSHYGTLVDGEQVGGESGVRECKLTPGTHRVQLGASASPFVLQVEVPEGDDNDR